MALPLSATTRAALWMSVAMLLFSAMTVLLRVLTADIPVHEIVFVRSVLSVALMLPWLYRRGFQALATRGIPMLVLRSVLTSVGLVLWIYALARLPLAETVSLHFTLPIFGMVLAMVLLREQVNAARWLATAVGFSGVLVILRPGLQAVDPVAFVVLASALAYAGVTIVTKVLVRTVSSGAIVFYVSLFMAAGFAVPSLVEWAAPTPVQWLLLLAIGGFNVSGQSCLNRAFHAADASFVLPFDFMRLPLTALAALFLFDEVPDLWTIVGALIIFGATYYTTWRARSRPAA